MIGPCCSNIRKDELEIEWDPPDKQSRNGVIVQYAVTFQKKLKENYLHSFIQGDYFEMHF